MRFFSGFATTKGQHRTVNQDSIAVFEAEYGEKRIIMAFVCDGMGGEENGEKASGTCLEVMEKWFSNILNQYEPDFSIVEIKNSLEKIIILVNELLCQYTNEKGKRLGTTISLLFINCNKEYVICHVGDSRIYLFDKNIYQLTIDQKKNNNELIECVGITNDINICFHEGIVKNGDAFLICSDGLYKTLSNKEILSYLKKIKYDKKNINEVNYISTNKVSECINQGLIEMIKRVIKKGETDNISAVYIIGEE